MGWSHCGMLLPGELYKSLSQWLDVLHGVSNKFQVFGSCLLVIRFLSRSTE